MQLVQTFVTPLSRAFHRSAHRPAGASVFELLSCCDVIPATWQSLVDAETEGPFSVLSFRHPLLLADIPGVLAEFVRNCCNRALFEHQGYTVEHAFAS